MESHSKVTLEELLDSFQKRMKDFGPFPQVPMSVIGKAVTRLSKTRVELDVPAQVALAIRSGSLNRTGGVVRDNLGRIRHHLKDSANVSTILKSPVLVLMALDFAEAALLNEKLREIQEQLGRMEGKLDDLTHSKVNAAFQEAASICHYQKTSDRRVRMHAALTMITEAIPLLEHRMAKAAQVAIEKANHHSEGDFFFESSQQKCCDEVFKIAFELFKDLKTEAALLALQARIQEELGEAHASSATRRKITIICLGWNELFEDVLGKKGKLHPENQKHTDLPGIKLGTIISNMFIADGAHQKNVQRRKVINLASRLVLDVTELSHAALVQDAIGCPPIKQIAS